MLIEGTGLRRGMQVLFSPLVDGFSSCKMRDAQGTLLGTDVPLTLPNVNEMTKGYAHAHLNVTGVQPFVRWSSLVADDTLSYAVCLSTFISSPFAPTDLVLRVRRNTIRTIDGRPNWNINVGFCGRVPVDGLNLTSSLLLCSSPLCALVSRTTRHAET